LQQRLFKTGGRLIRHARYFVLQLAESSLTGNLFRQILGRIERLVVAPDLSWGYRSRQTGMSGKERWAAVSLEDMVAAIKLGGNGSHRPEGSPE
jgi:hypothetical protein